MLDKEESHRLAAVIGVAKIDAARGIKYAEGYTIETVLWLATRLLEIDKEYKEIKDSRVILNREDRKLINDAKQRLMKTFRMTEDEAYAFINRAAMDARRTKVEIAKRILEQRTLV